MSDVIGTSLRGSTRASMAHRQRREESELIFDGLDLDGSGSASRAEIAKFVSARAELWATLSVKLNQPAEVAAQVATRVAMELASGLEGPAAMDAQLTGEEFHDFRKRYMLDPSGSQEFFQRAVFANFDKDNSGQLDEEELDHLLDTLHDARRTVFLGLPPKDQVKALIMKQLDVDGDKALSFTEIRSIISGGASAIAALQAMEAEDTNDDDDDGQEDAPAADDPRLSALKLLAACETPEEAAERHHDEEVHEELEEPSSSSEPEEENEEEEEEHLGIATAEAARATAMEESASNILADKEAERAAVRGAMAIQKAWRRASETKAAAVDAKVAEAEAAKKASEAAERAAAMQAEAEMAEATAREESAIQKARHKAAEAKAEAEAARRAEAEAAERAALAKKDADAAARGASAIQKAWRRKAKTESDKKTAPKQPSEEELKVADAATARSTEEEMQMTGRKTDEENGIGDKKSEAEAAGHTKIQGAEAEGHTPADDVCVFWEWLVSLLIPPPPPPPTIEDSKKPTPAPTVQDSKK